MTIGNPNEPGVTSSITSAPSVTTGGPSAGTPLIVGGADLASGSAAPNEIEGVADSNEAQNLFGKGSKLSRQIMDALNLGAQPVLAVAPAETTTSQDLSGQTEVTGTLDNPAKGDIEGMTVTVDSTNKTVVKTLEDLSSATVQTDEVYYNPTNDKFKLDAVPSSSGTFEYQSLDYASALDAVEAYSGDVDFVTTLKERSDVTTSLLGTVNAMETEYKFTLAVAGIPQPVDADAFTNSYDTSRLMLVTPTRLQNTWSILGSFVGMRGNIGLTTTPIGQRLPLRGRPNQGLDATERATLIGKNVTPMERIGESVRVVDDLTTVSEENSEEQNFKYSTSRLIVDFLVQTVNQLEKPFIGKFNSPGAVGQLQDLLNKGARPLSQSNVVYEHEANLTFIDPTTLKVTFRADVAEPIRFIENDFVIGQNLQTQS